MACLTVFLPFELSDLPNKSSNKPPRDSFAFLTFSSMSSNGINCSINFLSGSMTSEILPPKSLKNSFSGLQESYHLSTACEARFAASLRLKVPSTTLSINFLIMLSVGLNESNAFLKFFTIMVLPTKFLTLEIMSDTTSINVLRIL